MIIKQKLKIIKIVRQELKKDYGIGCKDFEWQCAQCEAGAVDNFLKMWEEDIKSENEEK